MQHKRYKKIGLWVAITLLTGTTFCPWEPSLAATAATIPNTQLPQGGNFVGQNQGQISQDDKNHTTIITQNNKNGVITWSGGFNVGANSTVEFRGQKDFNTLNYDKSGTMSQIHGKINSYENNTNNVTGNIYIVNPSGVQISNAAQINVGSLYVSNATLKDNQLNTFNGNNIDTLKDTTKTYNAELMSLGNINATNVTFSGNRVVLDVDRVKNGQNQATIAVQSGSNDVVLGSTDGTVGTNVTVNGQAVDNAKNQYNYKWIKNVNDLQNMNLALDKNYALNTSIDAIATKDWKDDNGDTYAKGFKPIGTDEHPFTGKFDGLGFSIFGLTINRNEKGDINTGLFGTTTGVIVQAPSKSGESVLLPNGGKVQVPNLTVQIPSGSVIKLPDGTTVKIDKAITVQIPSGGTAEKSDGTKIDLPGLIERHSDGKIVPIPSGSTTDLNNGSTVEFGNGTIQLPTGSTVDISGWSYSYPNPNPDPTNPNDPKTEYFGGGKVTVQSGAWTVQLSNGSVQIPSAIKNVNLIGGNVNGWDATGALVGHAVNTTISNIKNTVNVNGSRFVGGLVGQGEETTFKDVFNDATLQGTSSLGGIVGELKGGSVTGESYNMGTVRTAYYKYLYPSKTADYHGNIDQADMVKAETGQYAGGIVGWGSDITIGNASGFQIYNGMNVTSGSAVGGIAGHVEGDSAIQNVRNDGIITATYRKGIGDMINYGGANINDNSYGDATVFANAANAGGIVGEALNNVGYTVAIKNALNTNTVHSIEVNNLKYGNTEGITGYYAGNVGGIVGLAQNAQLSNVRNENASISGSHNVGGIAGRLDTFSSVTHGVNAGGAVTATGSTFANQILTAKDSDDFQSGLDEFQFANAGGIAGYVSRNGTIKSSSNTGNVTGKLSQRLTGANSPVFLVGVGGIVGRIDQLGTEVGTEQDVWNTLKGDSSKATVYDSYNTGTITGDRGVGGIAGAIYNGSISTSHNEGTVLTQGASGQAGSGSIGGIVGDARGNTAEDKGSVLFNVYNKGTVGDSTYAIGARHIGGIVGHLAGIVDGAYNIGAVYNNDSLTGGIAGWLPQGGVYNSFNAGTVNVKSKATIGGELSTAAGGIVGAAEGGGQQSIKLQVGQEFKLQTGQAIKLSGGDSKRYYNFSVPDGKDENGNPKFKIVTIKVEKDNDRTIQIGSPITADDGTPFTLNAGDTIKLQDGQTLLIPGGQTIKRPGGQDMTLPQSQTPISIPVGQLTLLALGQTITLQNVYNVGTVRATQEDTSQTATGVAGILGAIHDNRTKNPSNTIKLDHVYTTGNIYSNGRSSNGNGYILGSDLRPGAKKAKLDFNQVYYIAPEAGSAFAINNNGVGAVGTSVNLGTSTVTAIDYDNRYTANAWMQNGVSFFGNDTNHTDNAGEDGNVGSGWRQYTDQYGKTLPILNRFRPKGMDDWFNTSVGDRGGLLQNAGRVQFGNTANPFLTFVDHTGNAPITVDADKFHFASQDGIVANGNLVINNFSYHNLADNTDTPVAFGGTIAAYNGKLTITGNKDVTFGESSDLYGNVVNLDFGKAVLDVNGKIQATGWGGDDNGDITISAGTVDIQGKLKGATNGESIVIPGINMDYVPKPVTEEDLKDFTKVIPGQEAAYDTQKTDSTSKADGDITIKGENIQLLHGAKGTGKVSAGGSLTVGTKADSASAYVDSDIAGVKGTVTISSAQSTLDVTNISDDAFFTKHGNGNFINLEGGDNLVAFDGGADFGKVDAFLAKLQNTAIQSNGAANDKLVHIWVDTADQLQKIGTDANSLSRNYALRHTLDLSNVSGYQTIAGQNGQSFTGEFNGRGYSAVGLTVNDTTTTGGNLGLFGTIGQGGVVKNLTLHDIDIKAAEADNKIGLIAGTNNGTIDGVTSWGGTVAGKGTLGGIAGTNADTIQNVEANNMVYAESTDQAKKDTLGGIVGVNTKDGTIDTTLSNTGITNSGADGAQGYTEAMGGIVGANAGTLSTVTTTGVTSGIYKVDNPNNENQLDKTFAADNVGGIAGKNTGSIDGAYNDASVSGGTDVGGIIGNNEGTLKNAVNAMDVTGNNQNLGGLIGTNTGSVTSGRNNGIINGNQYVGGLVGVNAEGASLKDLNNDDSANITGNTYVGGIAGANSGTIDAQGSSLRNTGVITGQQYVGGVAGQNTTTGIISNTISNIVLNVKDENAAGNNAAQYFGGVVGLNEGTIQGGLNTGDIHADAASYVGGIIGQNKGILASVTNADGTVQGIGNIGNVTGKNYVGGIIGQNSQKIAGTTIQNTGSVTALDGGAGGIIGENSGAVGSDVNDDKVTNHTELVNAGKVNSAAKDTTGNIGTGGIFGVNHGAIQNTTMKNDVGGIVTGTKNVGGLIGYNDANITGSRDGANTYYKNQLINNGIVVGGTVDDKGKITINEQSQNIGGLIGNHAKGTLTAGYNTGTVQGGTNVGGIVGTNAGTVSQVFSTLANGQSVKGTMNVGGVIGANTGTLQNSYATHAVTGTTNVGNVVGDNSGTILNIYSQNNTGKLIGKKTSGTVTNAYSFVTGDDSATKVLTGDDQKKLASYAGFDAAEWKNYDGNTAPMLKVFLTKASFVPATGVDITKPITTYNGKIQSIVVKPLDTPDMQNGKTYQLGVYLHDGTTKADTLLGYIAAGNASDTHSYQDFIQSFAADATNLLNGTEGKNVKDLLTLWSQQIKTDRTDGVTNPNNLGYDIDNIKFDMAKRKVNVSLDDITRTYGDAAIHDGKNYGDAFHINWGTDATDEIKGEVTANNITVTETGDGAVTGNQTGRVTNDVGDYKWNANIAFKGNVNTDNYELATPTGSGSSYVEKAKLTVNVGNASTTYGTAFDATKYNYNVAGNTNGDTVDGLKQLLGNTYQNDQAFNEPNGKVTGDASDTAYKDALKLQANELKNYDVTVDNGDVTIGKAHLTVNVGSVSTEYGKKFDHTKYGYAVDGNTNGDTEEIVKNLVGGTVKNSQEYDGTNGKWTGNAAHYDDTMSLDGYQQNLQNYDVSVNNGDVDISKAQLHINANDAMTNVGIPPIYTGSDINGGLKNGDTISNADYHYGVKDTSVESIIGTHSGVIGLWHRNQFYTFDSIGDLGKAYPFLKNYNVLFTPGTLIVREIPTGQWDWLYKDYPWDKIKNFRERRAELHYVDGGVFIEQ